MDSLCLRFFRNPFLLQCIMEFVVRFGLVSPEDTVGIQIPLVHFLSFERWSIKMTHNGFGYDLVVQRYGAFPTMVDPAIRGFYV